MEVMLVAFLLPILQKDFNVSQLESTEVPLFAICGAFVGAFVLSMLSDRFGRRRLIIFGVVCTAIAAMVSAFAQNLWQENIARFFVGFFMKIGVVALTLFAELLPTAHRGKVLILQSAFWTFGLMASCLLAWVTLSYSNWRMYVKMSTLPLWVAAIGSWWMPESPHYLSTAGKTEECKKILLRISEWNRVSLPDGTFVGIRAESRGNVLKLFDPNEYNVFVSILLLFVYITYLSAYYGIIFVSVRYFAKLDSIYQLHHELYWEMMMTTFSELPGIAIGYVLIDRGRKMTMNVAFACFSVSTYCLVFIDFEYNRILGLVLLFISRMFIVVCGFGAGVYYLEYVRTSERAVGLGFAVSISMLTKFGAIVVAESMHIMFGMYIFGTIGTFAFIASLILPIDTPDSRFLSD